MIDERKAQKIYKVMCNAMRERFNNFDTEESKYRVKVLVTNSPFNVEIDMKVQPDEDVVTVYSRLRFEFPTNNIEHVAAALCQLNYNEFYCGVFDLNPKSGEALFRMSVPLIGVTVSEELFDWIITYVQNTMNRLNWRLFLLSRGEEE